MSHPTELLTNYNIPLILLSFVIAACASFCALELVVLVNLSRGRARLLWLGAGALTFGLGTWAMHFVGMLAFELPVAVGYHLPTVFLSMLPVMGATALALRMAASGSLTKPRLIGGAVLLGSGIGGMHYSGMLSMRMAATTYYDPKFLLLSVVFAVGASLFALHSAFNSLNEYALASDRFISAGMMGGAITGLHYIAMISASSFIAAQHDVPGGMIVSPLTTAAPTGPFVVQVSPAVAVLIAIAMLATISVVLRRARRATPMSMLGTLRAEMAGD